MERPIWVLTLTYDGDVDFAAYFSTKEKAMTYLRSLLVDKWRDVRDTPPPKEIHVLAKVARENGLDHSLQQSQIDLFVDEYE